MKTTFNSLLATGLIALAITSSSVVLASDIQKPDKANKVKTVSANSIKVASIKRLVVTGAVDVMLVQSPTSDVLYTNEDKGEVTLKKVGDVLYIVGKKGRHGAKVTVYVDDIYRIEASQNAVINSDQPLNLKYLQIYLKDNAYADLNTKTESLLTVMENTSKLNLRGTTGSHTITMNKEARLTLEGFKSRATDRLSEVYVASRK